MKIAEESQRPSQVGLGLRLANVLVQYRLASLVVALVLAILALPLSGQLKMDRRLEKMMVTDDPAVQGYLKLQERFGGNDFILLMYRDEAIWNEDRSGIERLKKITSQLSDVQGVQAVMSLAEIDSLLQTISPSSLTSSFFSKRTTSGILAPDEPLAVAFRDLFAGYTHQPGRPFVAAACLLQPLETSGVSRDEVVQAVRDIANDLPDNLEPGLITGEPVLLADGFRLVEADGARLGWSASIILGVVLLFMFRSLRWVIVPLVLVQWSLLVTRGALVAMGGELSMVSSMMTAIITVIGVATTIHLLVEYQTQLQETDESSPQESSIQNKIAMTQTFANLLSPIGWSCLTTAAGFAGLMLARVGPVRDFGWIMALSVLVVWGGTLLLIPGLALLGNWDRRPRRVPQDRWIQQRCSDLLQYSLTHRRLVLLALALLTFAGALGSYMVKVETDFIQSFRADSPLVRAYDLVENELGGAGIIDVLLPAPPTLTDNYLADVRRLESELRSLQIAGTPPIRLTKVLSLADADEASKSSRLLALVPSQARLEGMRQTMPEFYAAMATSKADKDGFQWLRLMLRSPERAEAAGKISLINAIEKKVNDFTQTTEWRNHFKNESPPQAQVTGYYILLARLVDSLLSDQWICLAVATLTIWLMLCIAQGGWWNATASLVPNMLPIILVWGGMGFLGIKIDMGAVMIAAVSIGLSIDGSIHYIHRARRASSSSSKGHDRFLDLDQAQRSTGLALLVATLALVLGFSSLTISEFRPTVTFGVSVSLTMLGGLIGNLIILPILVHNPKRSTSVIESQTV